VYLKILLKEKKYKICLNFFTLANCAGKSTYFLGSECVNVQIHVPNALRQNLCYNEGSYTGWRGQFGTE